jgi:hypothetical protein
MDFSKQNDRNNNTIMTPSISISEDNSLLLCNTTPEVVELQQTLMMLESADPLKAINIALDATKKYDDEPILAYHLATAAKKSGNNDLAKQIIDDNYRKFPFFLLIRCRYALKCLEEGKLIEAASTLAYTFDLKTLYPQRSLFHYGEIISFYALIVQYFCDLKDFDRAAGYLRDLISIDKNLPIISELRNIIVMSTLQQSISPTNIEAIFATNKDEENKENNE